MCISCTAREAPYAVHSLSVHEIHLENMRRKNIQDNQIEICHIFKPSNSTTTLAFSFSNQQSQSHWHLGTHSDSSENATGYAYGAIRILYLSHTLSIRSENTTDLF